MSNPPTKAKSSFTNSEFPVDAEKRTYHIGVKVGEVSNRLLTVGDVNRAKVLEQFLSTNTPIFRYLSDRGFYTVTGLFNGVPVTIQSSLMGYPNLDFQIREDLAVVRGTLVVIRFGTCGSPHCNIGDLALATQCRGIYRNPDAFRSSATIEQEKARVAAAPSGSTQAALYLSPEKYHVTLPTLPDPALFALMKNIMLKEFPTSIHVGLNFSGCTFYASQGRASADIDDHNEDLLQHLDSYPDATSIEMETFHLYDLGELSRGRLKTAGAALILAQRDTHAFLSIEKKEVAVPLFGKALLQVLAEFPIPEADLMKGPECVWPQ